MTNDIKNTIMTNLGESILTIANTIVNITLQGYVVNNSKYCNFNKTVILHQMFKNYNSFDKDRKKKLEQLYNTL